MKENNYHINDDLLVKYLLGEASPEETLAIEAWVRETDENRTYLEQLRSVWEQSKILASVSTVDEKAAWKRFEARIKAPQEASPIRSFSWMRIAALFIIVAGLALVLYVVNQEPLPKQRQVQAFEKVVKDTLPDGSVITLNKNASLTYPDRFAGDTRAVTLKGEAFFNITPDKNKPFIIQVNDVLVKVVGTSFNIRSLNGKTEVIVETGVVQVIRQHKQIELHPREKVIVPTQDSAWQVEKESDRLYNYYRSKEFVCENTPLWKLVDVLNEAYGSDIRIGRPSLRNLPLTTTFNNESLDRILEIISVTFDIKVTRSSNTIILQ
ncbi:MAG TPA: FecR domain-containing protein [Flavisolibacter sp.]|nr:FecR domain-containing protein [Flavisolibacter sp.]